MSKLKPLLNLTIYLFVFTFFNLIIEKLSFKTPLLIQIVGIFKYIFIALIFIFLNKDNLKNQYLDFKNNLGKYLKKYLPIWFIGVILMIVSNYFITKYYTIPNNEESLRNHIDSLPFLAISITCLFAPIIEEFTFRAGFNTIKNKYIFLIVSSLVFAFLHLNSFKELPFLISYSIIGLVFGYTYFKTKNIFASISIHMIHNIFTLIIYKLF